MLADNTYFRPAALCLILAAAVVSISCTREDEIPDTGNAPASSADVVPEGWVRIEFDLIRPGGSTPAADLAPTQATPAQADGDILPPTKTSLSDGEVAFTDGDIVRIIWGPGAEDHTDAPVSFAGGSPKLTATVADGKDAYFAVYPSSLAVVYTDENTIEVTIPNRQGGTFADVSYICAKTNLTEKTFSFHHICAYFSFTLSSRSDIKQALIRAVNSKNLCGAVDVTFDGLGDIEVGTCKTGGRTEVWANNVGNGSGTYYLAVLPGVDLGSDGVKAGFGLRFSPSTESGKWYPMVVSRKGFTTERGNYYPIGVVDDLISYDYFVTPDGTGNGRSWETAAGISTVQSLLNPSSADNISTLNYRLFNRRFRFREGEYGACASTASYKVPLNYSFYGGYASSLTGTSTSTRYYGATVFTQGTASSPIFTLGGANTTEVLFDGITFKAPSSTCDGSGITINEADTDVTINRCSFNQCKAAEDGGAIKALDANSITVTSSSFAKNESGRYGGAVYTEKDISFDNCSFSTNKADVSSSAAYGGAIFAMSATADINSCTFESNRSYSGAALSAAGAAVLKVNAGIFNANSAFARGAVYASMLAGSTAKAWFNNCVFRGNNLSKTASEEYHGVLVNINKAGTFLGMHNCSSYNNTASGSGNKASQISIGLNTAGAAILGSTIIGESESTAYPLVRFTGGATSTQVLYGSVVINTSETDKTISAGGTAANKYGRSGGYNYLSAPANFASASAYDTAEADEEQFSWYGGEYWYWDGSGPSYYGSASAMSAAAALAGDDGTAFLKWAESKGSVGKDITGGSRGSSGWWPGSYQGGTGVDAVDLVKVMSFNMLSETTETAGTPSTYTWEFRKGGVVSMLSGEAPLVAGTQETDRSQKDYILSECTNYNCQGVSHYSSPGTGPANRVFYNASPLACEAYGTFWLSETPETESRLEGATNRTATWTRLRLKGSGKRFIFVSTHLQNGSNSELRVQQAQILKDQIDIINDESLPVIIAGDFNDSPTAASVKVLTDDGYVYTRDAASSASLYFTYHGFGTKSSTIDFILAKGFNVRSYAVLTTSWNNVTYISDHYPVTATLEF